MINYTSENKFSLSAFKTPFETVLLSTNRWVVLSRKIPWDEFASIYISIMNRNIGRPGLSPRMVLGALIIKYQENLDDRGVIAAIQENVYLQFFVGLKDFSTKPIFDPSLFVEIRKRVGSSEFEALNTQLIHLINKEKTQKKGNASKPNEENIQKDASVADPYSPTFTDSKLLNNNRKKCEKLIDKLYVLSGKKGEKPRTYRRILDTAFINYAKKTKKTIAVNRKMNRKLLEGLKRDFGHLNKLIHFFENGHVESPLTHREQKMLWMANTVYEQQKHLYDNKTRMSSFQPDVGPIPREIIKSKI